MNLKGRTSAVSIECNTSSIFLASLVAIPLPPGTAPNLNIALKKVVMETTKL